MLINHLNKINIIKMKTSLDIKNAVSIKDFLAQNSAKTNSVLSSMLQGQKCFDVLLSKGIKIA